MKQVFSPKLAKCITGAAIPLLLYLCCVPPVVVGWVPTTPRTPGRTKLYSPIGPSLQQARSLSLITGSTSLLASDVATSMPPAIGNDDDEADDDEWEYVEFEELTESDMVNSEWLVGSNWDNSIKSIDETWCRLVVDEAGKNVCVWGDGSQGRWSMDQASQYFSISKDSFFGKQIWATTAEDYYFLQGTIRGWTYLTPASVLGQWQARRLGVDKDEAGVAPWFQEDDEENIETEKAASEDPSTDDGKTDESDAESSEPTSSDKDD